MAWFSNQNKGRSGEPEHFSAEARSIITHAQKINSDAVFHGQCLRCLNLKGNNRGEGMRYCLGCAISHWDDTQPNRYISAES